MPARPEPNICRYEHHHFAGWQVCVKRGGRRHVRYVADKDYGGRSGALAVARCIRQELIEALPPEVRIKSTYAPNRTGVVGVTLSSERSRSGTGVSRYSAVWPRVDGHGVHKRSFSIARWGRAEAFRRAVAARQEGLAQLLQARRLRPLPQRKR